MDTRIESLTPALEAYIGRGMKEIAGFVLILIVLMVRPYGLFGKPDIERAYSTHWVSPLLAEAKRRRLAERQSLEREQLDGVVR